MGSALVSVETLLLIPILLILSLPFLILKSRRKPGSFEVPPLPPGPHPWPIIGNLSQIGNKPHVALTHMAEEHGPLISLRLGTQIVIVGSSPAAATAILKTQDRLLSGRYVPHVSYAKSPDLNHLSLGWTFECTERWKFLRTLCRSELFAAKVIDGQSSLRERKVNEMVGFLGSKEGELVKIGEIVFATVFNFLCNIFFSKDFIAFEGRGGGCGGGGMKDLTRRLMEIWTTPNISDFYPILGGLDLQGLTKKSNECVGRICGLWESIIRERRNNRGDHVQSHRDFLDVMLDNGFSNNQINLLLLELFAAGTDTTTSTIEWAMAELIRKKEAMDKICEEIDREITENVVRESHLPNLPYLHACVKETLRLHPPAPFLLPHRATATCQLMNYTVPKDSQVLVNVWAIGRDPTIWEDPLSFKPERFLINSDLDFKGNDFEFLPFGGGRRICPGLPMAVREIHLSLASLIHHFEWSLPQNMVPHQLDMNEKFGITLQKEQTLVMVPKRRM